MNKNCRKCKVILNPMNDHSHGFCIECTGGSVVTAQALDMSRNPVNFQKRRNNLLRWMLSPQEQERAENLESWDRFWRINK